jgi:hypothetical protein
MSASRSIAEVVPEGDLRASLEAMRDALAAQTDEIDLQHRQGCRCSCGPRDGQLLAALTKRIEEIVLRIADLPEEEGKSDLDRLSARVDDLAPRRAARGPGSAAS